MTYDARKDSFDSYNVAIAAQRAALLKERCPPAKRVEVIEQCELYLGDSAEILPILEAVAGVVTDPPYGIGAGRMSLGKWRTSRMTKGDWDACAPDLTNILDLGVPTIVWGGNYFDLRPSRGYLVWDKGAGFRGRDFAECEFAWTSIDMNARVLSHDPLARGDYKDKVHPTQKPIPLMSWCLSFIEGNGTILDPFMGSGSTGVACAKRRRPFVGIEINEEYFDAACQRIRDAYRQTDLFAAPVAKAAPSQQFGLGLDEATPSANGGS